MRKFFFIPLFLLAAITVNAQAKKPTTPAAKPKPTVSAAAVKPLKTKSDSLSYAFGISLGEYLKSQGMSNINYVLLNKAIDQTLKNQTTYFGSDKANAVIGSIAQEKAMKITSAEKEKGRKFLELNARKTGVKQTASGLQYEVLVEGKGVRPTAADTIMAHYKGTLMDGTEFDNSYTRGQPLQIPVGGVIPGWTEALQLMPLGSKWRLYIPSSLGYGDYGAGGEIPGGATLIFEVELLDIVNKKL